MTAKHPSSPPSSPPTPPWPPLQRPLLIIVNNIAQRSAGQPSPQGRPPFPPPRGQVRSPPPPPLTVIYPIVHDGPNEFGHYHMEARPYGHFVCIPTGPPIPFRMPMPQPLSNHSNSHPRPQPHQLNQNKAKVDAETHGTGVFLPRPPPQVPVTNNYVNARINKGASNKQEAGKGSTYQVWVPKSQSPSTSIGSTEEEKQQKEECGDNDALSDELALPKE